MVFVRLFFLNWVIIKALSDGVLSLSKIINYGRFNGFSLFENNS